MVCLIPFSAIIGVYAETVLEEIRDNNMKLSLKSDEELWKFDVDGKVYEAFIKAKEVQNKNFKLDKNFDALKGLNLRD